MSYLIGKKIVSWTLIIFLRIGKKSASWTLINFPQIGKKIVSWTLINFPQIGKKVVPAVMKVVALSLGTCYQRFHAGRVNIKRDSP